MSLPPWNKEMKDIQRYDWLTALSVHPVHFEKPRDLRMGNCLMQHMNADTGLAFPTQETLARWTRLAGDRQVREGIYSLEDTGAITRKRMDELQPETAEIVRVIGHRSNRAVVYKLNMFWAFETFEAYRSHMANGNSEARKIIAARMQHRPVTDRYDRPESDRNKPVYDRPANTVEDTVETLSSAGSEKSTQDSILVKGRVIDPLILVPPDDPDKRRLWLYHLCSDKSRIAWALAMEAEGKLTTEIIKELAA